MNRFKHLAAGALIALSATLPVSSLAAAPPGAPLTILDEGFNDLAALGNWLMVNNSTPPGQSWFQGNAGIFPAYAGAPGAYAAANFLSAQNGSGFIDNWLITPELTLLGPTTLSFLARAASAPGFHGVRAADTLEIRFGTLADSFGTLLGTVGGASAFPISWEQFSASVNITGTGRFAFRYVGDAAASNYIGLDSVLVATVPEPSAWLMLMAGALLIGAARRQALVPRPGGKHHVPLSDS